MKLNFEIVKVVGNGNFPDVVDFANTQAQLLFLQGGLLNGTTTNEIPFGAWENANPLHNWEVSPNSGMSNFQVEVMPGWGVIGNYKNGDYHNMLIYEFNEYDYRNYVDYKSYIEVRGADNIKTAFLHPQSDAVKDCFIDNRLNGDSVLEFSIPANSKKIDALTPECVFHAGWKAYILRDDSIDTVRDESNRLWTKVTAVERFYELDEEYVEPSISNDPSARPPADLAVIIVGGGSDLSNGRYTPGTASHAMYSVLKGSNWKLGVCDIEGIHDIELEKESRLSIIKQIQDIWGGYLVWDSVNRVVSLRDPNKWQRYSGFQIKYAKNLKHITRTQSNKLVTKLYPFGHDDLDIAAVNGGVKYITNNDYTPREYVGMYKNQDIYSQTELMVKAANELKLMSRPRYLYSVKLVDIRALPEFSHEDYFLGDMVDVIDPDIAPDSPRPRLIRHKYNLFRPWECDFDIGDPEERLIERLKASFNTSGFVNTKFNSAGEFSGHSLEDMTVRDAKIRSLTADKLTAGTIDAEIINVININAENITTGFLSADRIEADSIGADKIKTNELIVGDNISMGANAYISWDNVSGIPGDIAYAGDIQVVPSYIKSTYIDFRTVASPRIYGGEIIGGQITSDSTINITTDAFIGEKLHFDIRYGFMGGIDFGVAEIYIDPAGGGLFLTSAGGIYANGTKID